MTPDPNGAHAIPLDKRCKCGAELAHPDEIKAKRCYPCIAKSLKDEFYLGNEAYARDDKV